MKVAIKTWKAVAAWKWDMPEDDVCGICRHPYDATCAKCKYPGDGCPLCMSPAALIVSKLVVPNTVAIDSDGRV